MIECYLVLQQGSVVNYKIVDFQYKMFYQCTETIESPQKDAAKRTFGL